MARWISPKEQKHIKTGELKIVLNKKKEITLTTLQSDLTTNMYGDLTDTFDTLISICHKGSQNQVIKEKLIEGKFEDIRIVRMFNRFFLSISTKKRTYCRPNSNALFFIKYKYLLDLSSCKMLYILKQEPSIINSFPIIKNKPVKNKLTVRIAYWFVNWLFYQQFPFSIVRKEQTVDILLTKVKIDL